MGTPLAGLRAVLSLVLTIVYSLTKVREMNIPAIQQIRSFNRTVAERIGAVDDKFLRRPRPYGETRLLWEIGPDGADIREIRRRLSIDSGYLSRVLRSLER